MKYILLLVLVFSTLFSNEKQKVTLGAGAYLQSQPYANVDSIVLPSPVIFFDNGLVYARWTRFGVYFLGEKTPSLSWGFSFTAQPRVYGYDASDIPGMDERKNSWEGGIAFSAQKEDAHIEIMALHDLLNNHDSWLVTTELGYDFKVGDFSFYPSIIAEYQSKDFVNYYYGIKANEATRRGVAAYTPNSGLQVGVQTYISYPLSEELTAFVNLRADRLSSQATSSSLVDDNYIYSGLLSLLYTFEY